MKTSILALGAATFLALAAPAFAAPPASGTPAASSSSSAAANAAVTRSIGSPARQLLSRAQTKLKQDNLYNGPINGQRTDATVQAIRSFQTAHRLTVNGRLDSATRRALGI